MPAWSSSLSKAAPSNSGSLTIFENAGLMRCWWAATCGTGACALGADQAKFAPAATTSAQIAIRLHRIANSRRETCSQSRRALGGVLDEGKVGGGFGP